MQIRSDQQLFCKGNSLHGRLRYLQAPAERPYLMSILSLIAGQVSGVGSKIVLNLFVLGLNAGFARLALDLVEGTYKLDVAIHKRDGAPYDYHRLLYTFRVKSRLKDVGIYRPRHHWQFSPNVKFRIKT